MKCEKCGGEWMPPKNISISLTNCPFCGAPVLNADTAKGYTDMGEFLQYLVSLYGIDLYNNQRKLNNLIADLYQGDERMKRVYRRAILDDSLSKRIFDLSKKPLDEREAYYNQIINQFSEANFYAVDFGKQVIESFVSGLKLEIIVPIPFIEEKKENENKECVNKNIITQISISTEVLKDDGEWYDGDVEYSADKKKLKKGFWILEEYNILSGTIAICDSAFAAVQKKEHYLYHDYFCNLARYGMDTRYKNYEPDFSLGYGEDYYTRLKSISIPDTVLYIGKSAFRMCINLSKVILSNSLISIGDSAFARCYSLISIIIPDTVTSIGNGAFYGCAKLSDIKLSKSLKRIGKYTFERCKSLKEIIIPDSVTSIEGGAFPVDDDFRIILESNKHFIFMEGILYTSDMKELIYCHPKKEGVISIPKSVINIADSAFRSCKLVTNIIIPESVTSIGDSAFAGCKSLMSITIPDTITSIGMYVINRGCAVKTIYISNKLNDKIKEISPNEFDDYFKGRIKEKNVKTDSQPPKCVQKKFEDTFAIPTKEHVPNLLQIIKQLK